MKASKFTEAQKAFILKQGGKARRSPRSVARRGSVRRPTSTGRSDTAVCCRTRCSVQKALEEEKQSAEEDRRQT